ncbi:MAG TPA: hypothetical protein VK590_04965 [Saprospiraceae bacterium]|nr:hypothetical protein [Saprospiraceae bacterium]
MIFLPYLVYAFCLLDLQSNQDDKTIVLLDLTSRINFCPESKMYLTGSTNFLSFKCDCQAPDNKIPLTLKYKDKKAYFENTSLNISSRNINCHQRLYNNNIKKALEADAYPNIQIDLLEAWKTDNTIFLNENGWFEIISNANLTIKKTTRNCNIKAKAIRIDKNKYRIKGNKLLSLEEFKVTVPQLMFGLISVDDIIDFNFDLVIEILN